MRVMVMVKATKDSEAGVLPDEKLLTDGIDSSIPSLAQYAGARPSKELVDGLAEAQGMNLRVGQRENRQQE